MHIHLRVHPWVVWWFVIGAIIGLVVAVNMIGRHLTERSDALLVSLGVIQFSLMAAYSSTSFGILFVFIFKICSLRPVRRRLLLAAEEDTVRDTAATSGEPALATMP